MPDIDAEIKEKMRRSINQEFCRMEDDFDDTRDKRKVLVDKLFQDAVTVKLVDDRGGVGEVTDVGVRLINSALKGLTDIEKANSQSIGLRLRRSEQEAATAAATKDRVEIVIKATQPGRIHESFPVEKLEEQLAEMFGKDINDFELKDNPRDINDG